MGDEFMYASADLDWVEITPPPCDAHPGLRAHHAMLWLGDALVLYGGVCELRRGYSSKALTERHDPGLYLLHLQSGEWFAPPIDGPLPEGRAATSLCVWADRFLVVFGGRVSTTRHAVVWRPPLPPGIPGGLRRPREHDAACHHVTPPPYTWWSSAAA